MGIHIILLGGTGECAAGINRIVVNEVFVTILDSKNLGLLITFQLIDPSSYLFVVELHHVLINLTRGLPVFRQNHPV